MEGGDEWKRIRTGEGRPYNTPSKRSVEAFGEASKKDSSKAKWNKHHEA